MTLSSMLAEREKLLVRWAAACQEVVAAAEDLDVERVATTIADRESILGAIMAANQGYAWSDGQLQRMRALEDEVENAVADCYAKLRDEVTASRQRRAGIQRYAGQMSGG